jgi:enterochelin esterase-like enzyme
MTNVKQKGVVTENHILTSTYLLRDVKVDCYLPERVTNFSEFSLLLINDGQDLITMEFNKILDKLNNTDDLRPLFCVGIHCAPDRKNEYGTAKYLDYKGRGVKADLFNLFIFKELLPFIRKEYNVSSFKEKAYAGFSLGGLCAMDIVWNNAIEFTKVGAFSGSFWWRDKDQEDANFDENIDRIMHRQIREGKYAPWLQFFFEVGTKDETADRNNNGVIDAIDDTVELIAELEKIGYKNGRDINYLELKDGTHDVATWASAFPAFLKWGWGVDKEVMD